MTERLFRGQNIRFYPEQLPEALYDYLNTFRKAKLLFNQVALSVIVRKSTNKEEYSVRLDSMLIIQLLQLYDSQIYFELRRTMFDHFYREDRNLITDKEARDSLSSIFNLASKKLTQEIQRSLLEDVLDMIIKYEKKKPSDLDFTKKWGFYLLNDQELSCYNQPMELTKGNIKNGKINDELRKYYSTNETKYKANVTYLLDYFFENITEFVITDDDIKPILDLLFACLTSELSDEYVFYKVFEILKRINSLGNVKEKFKHDLWHERFLKFSLYMSNNAIVRLCREIISDHIYRNSNVLFITKGEAQELAVKILKDRIQKEPKSYEMIEEVFHCCYSAIRPDTKRIRLIEEARETFLEYVNELDGRKGFIFYLVRNRYMNSKKMINEFVLYPFWDQIFVDENEDGESLMRYIEARNGIIGSSLVKDKYLEQYKNNGFFRLDPDDLKYFIEIHPEWQNAKIVN